MGIFSGGEVSRSEFERLSRRLEQLERQVAELSLRVDLNQLPPHDRAAALAARGPDLTEVMALVQRGKKIEAIKVYREITGVGLREAKEAVERL